MMSFYDVLLLYLFDGILPSKKNKCCIEQLGSQKVSNWYKILVWLKNTSLDCVHMKSEEALFLSSHKRTYTFGVPPSWPPHNPITSRRPHLQYHHIDDLWFGIGIMLQRIINNGFKSIKPWKHFGGNVNIF